MSEQAVIDFVTNQRWFGSKTRHVSHASVVDRARDPVTSRALDTFLAASAIEIEAVTPEQARIARDAYRDFGKGSGHRARLNFGDCFAYALAKATGKPLLFKGTDFAQTDINSAIN